MSFKRILIAVDESTIAAHAADVGTELAKSLKAEMAFVYVTDPATLDAASSGVPSDVLLRMAEQEAKKLLAAFRERAPMSPAALEFLEVGNPAAKIVEGAKNWSADVIVIGSHGRGKVQKLLLGSVAEGVVRHAPCPVLVVRAQA